METIVLYVDLLSQPARTVMIFFDICKVPYQKIEVRIFKGEHLTDEYKKVSPTQTIPTMVHGDLVLYESHAIMSYVARLFNVPDHWYPTNLTEKSLVDCYLHWHHLHIRLGCSIFLQNKFLAPLLYNKSFPDIDLLTTQAREDSFHMLSSIFSQNQFVARTQAPSIADLACYSELTTLKWVGFDFSKFPQIQTWMSKIGSIPEVRKFDEFLFRVTPKIKL